MKFRIHCKNDVHDWWEDYDKDEVDDPVDYAIHIVHWFNSTLKVGELRRTLLEVDDGKTIHTIEGTRVIRFMKKED